MRIKNFTTALFLSVSLFALPALAQETPDDAAIVTYDREYFEKYSPVTLLDILQRIPGVPEILAQNREQNRGGGGGGGGANDRAERGFGSGGDQILIDGKRLAGKSNNIDDTLSRISSAQVEKVELIRGAASGLDVQSQGLVINISLLEGSSTSTTFWKVGGKYVFGHNFTPEFLLSHSGSSGSFQYMLSAERKNSKGDFDRDELHYNALDLQTGEKFITVSSKRKSILLNTNLSYDFDDGAVLRLNGLFEPGSDDRYETQIETGTEPLHTLWDTAEDTDKWEIGGDYSRGLGVLGQLKTLFVVNRDKSDLFIDRTEVNGATSFQYAREETTLNKSEKIFRGSLTKGITGTQTIEIGGEAAINTFDKSFNDVRRSAAADPFLPNASDNVEIQENRYEIFANHTFDIADNLVLQSSLVTEFSKIVADNIFDDGTISRRDTSFKYLKPRMNLRYDVSTQDQLRFTVEKKVSQLNFDNFVTSFDQRTKQFVFGNTNIRPEQVWEFSTAYEHRLANDGGSLEAEIFYRRYNDYITKVDFTEYTDTLGNIIDRETFFALDPDMAHRDMINFTSKSGNIDKATAKGIKLKSNIRLGFVGVPQAVISLGYTFEKRRYTDQFTFAENNFERVSDHTFTFNFRHDVTDWDFSYGLEAGYRTVHTSYERNYTWPWKPDPEFQIFLEKNIFYGIKLRVEASQGTGATGHSTLNIYNDHRRFNDLSERSEKEHIQPREIKISLQGTF